MKSSPLWLLPLSLVLAGCNMVISETPMLSERDRASLLPRDGLWLGNDPDCQFDSARPETEWPECALWVIVRKSGGEMQLTDGKGQTQRIGGLFVSGNPAIVQGEWIDDAKDPTKAYYGFYGLEPRNRGPDGRFTLTSVWPVACGVQSGSEIEPFPGINEGCRASSKEAIR
ncbi:MAG TPA: hypothetical protein VFU80_02920, partial [Sphingomicrobium sp.]|nr:hypothetical protein [Sphingomicrobium sp.]